MLETTPLPKTPAELAAIVALVRDATRVEKTSLELDSALRNKGQKEQADQLEPKREELSLALDRHPPDLELIRASLFQLQPSLEQVFSDVEVQPDRLRNGVAAAITYARFHTKGYDLNHAEAVRRRAEWLADEQPNILSAGKVSQGVRLLLTSGGPVEFIDILNTGGGVYSYTSGLGSDPVVLPLGPATAEQFFASAVLAGDGQKISSKISPPAPKPSMPSLPVSKGGEGRGQGR